MFIKKKVLKSMLYDIEEYKKCIENLRKEISEVRMLAYRGGYIIMNGHNFCVNDEYSCNSHSVPVAEVLVKLFEQKKWDVGIIPAVPSGIEIREFKGLSSRRLK